eukprot:6994603-Prymnesium_polylepis.1
MPARREDLVSCLIPNATYLIIRQAARCHMGPPVHMLMLARSERGATCEKLEKRLAVCVLAVCVC